MVFIFFIDDTTQSYLGQTPDLSKILNHMLTHVDLSPLDSLQQQKLPDFNVFVDPPESHQLMELQWNYLLWKGRVAEENVLWITKVKYD